MIPDLPPRFINWRMVDGKKKPCRPNGDDRNFDPHDVTNHLSYEQASQSPHPVGFALRAEDGLFFLDLDKCFDPATQQWTAEASAIWSSFNGAWGEVSQSGTGLHIMGYCDPSKLQDRRNKWDGWLEFYTDKRFVAFGPHGWNPIGGTATGLDWTDQLLKVVPERPYIGDLPDGRDAAYTGPEDDDELIRIMLRSTSAASAFGEGVTIKDLWEANAPALARKYPAYDGGDGYDASSADMALMSHLAFWTGKDMPRMDRLFRRSSLMRDKYEKRKDYRRDTIQDAARLCKRVYDRPARPNPAPAAASGGTDSEMYLTVPEMIEHFKGCVYVSEPHRVLIPDGSLLKPEQFKAKYGGHVFQMQHDGLKPVTNAFEALTENRAYRFRQARRAVFHPDLPFQSWISDDVNVFLPAEVDSSPGDITLFWDFLQRLLPDETDRTILVAWCIDMVQNPGVKMLWAPVLQGTEGNGKSLIFEILQYTIGEEFCHTARSKEIGSTFNGWQANKLLIHVPEIHMGGRREILDDLKPNITDYRLPIRHMHQTEANSHVPTNWFFTTNHKDAVIKSKSDRRYAIFFTAQQCRADVERDFPDGFFPALYDWLRDGNGYSHIAHYLKTAQADSRFSPMRGCVRAPETSSTLEAMRASTGGIEAEVEEAVETGTDGFRGGWISSFALDQLLRDRGLRLTRPRVNQMLTDLGYVQWGRAPRPIVKEFNKRPVLWTKGVLDLSFEQYLKAQGPNYD